MCLCVIIIPEDFLSLGVVDEEEEFTGFVDGEGQGRELEEEVGLVFPDDRQLLGCQERTDPGVGFSRLLLRPLLHLQRSGEKTVILRFEDYRIFPMKFCGRGQEKWKSFVHNTLIMKVITHTCSQQTVWSHSRSCDIHYTT